MKTLLINLSKRLAGFSFVLLLLTNACVQSNSRNDQKQENNSKIRMTVKPKIDIQSAIISGNLEAVRQHIEAGTDINVKDQMSGATPLITAATFGKTGIVKALIDANADLSLTNREGATALHVAAFFCRIEIVQMLIDARADKNVKNNFGATPRETVMAPFTEVKPIYEMLQQQLEPFGFSLDLKDIEKNRPVISMMLQ